MAVDKDTFFKVMGSFAAGVTVVTTTDPDGQPCGLTATAFSSVSLNPPLALVCIDKGAASHAAFAAADAFGVNFLAVDQVDVSARFAKAGADKFGETNWHKGELGVPLIDGTIGFAECKVAHAYDGGDHTIFVGQIEVAEASEGEPLAYFRGAYRKVADI